MTQHPNAAAEPRTFDFPIITNIPMPRPRYRPKAADRAHQFVFDMMTDDRDDLYAGLVVEHFVWHEEFIVHANDGGQPRLTDAYVSAKVRDAFAAWQAAGPKARQSIKLTITPRTGWEGLEDIDGPGLSLRFEAIH